MQAYYIMFGILEGARGSASIVNCKRKAAFMPFDLTDCENMSTIRHTYFRLGVSSTFHYSPPGSLHAFLTINCQYSPASVVCLRYSIRFSRGCLHGLRTPLPTSKYVRQRY